MNNEINKITEDLENQANDLYLIKNNIFCLSMIEENANDISSIKLALVHIASCIEKIVDSQQDIVNKLYSIGKED